MNARGPSFRCSERQWDAVKEVFDLALDVPTAERRDFLDAATNDSLVREEVLRLLTQWNDAESWFERAGKSITAIESTPALDSGEILAGRYRIIRFISQGGMGEVYEAEDTLLSGSVALKILRPSISRQPGIESRFRKEIHLSRTVKSPHVCRVHDIETHREPGGRENAFYTMELLSGITLASRLKEQQRFTLQQARPIIAGMAIGLDTAHRAGVLHCDFKPGNVILTSSGPVITDFGLAKEIMSNWEALAGATPGYSAPEQLAGGMQSAATDVYSFGVVVYEMLTGRLPSEGPLGSVPFVVQQCLAQQPSDRPSSPLAVAKKLGALESDHLFNRRLVWLLPLSAVGLGAGFKLTRSKGPMSKASGRIVIAEVAAADEETHKQLRTLPVLLREQLSQSGLLIPVPAREIREAASRIVRSGAPSLTMSDWRQIALRCGASTVIIPQFRDEKVRDGRSIRLTMERLGDSATAPLESRSQSFTLADITSLPTMVQDASVWIRQNVGESHDRILASSLPLNEITTASWQALNDFVASESALNRELELAYLHSATSRDPEFALAWTRLGDLYYAAARDDKGQECYRKAIDCAGNRLAPREEFRVRSILANDQWDYPEADRQFQIWTARFPLDQDVGIFRVSSLLALDRAGEAVALYLDLTAKQPKNPSVFRHLALSYLFAGQYNEMDGPISRLRELNQLDHADHWRAAQRFQQGRTEDAVAVLRRRLAEATPQRRLYHAYWLLWARAWAGGAAASLRESGDFRKLPIPTGGEGYAADLYIAIASLMSVTNAGVAQIVEMIDKALALSGGPNHALRAGVVLARVGRLQQCRQILDTYYPEPKTIKEKLWRMRLRAHIAYFAGAPRDSVTLFEQARLVKTNRIEPEWGLIPAYRGVGDGFQVRRIQDEMRKAPSFYWWWPAPELTGMIENLV